MVIWTPSSKPPLLLRSRTVAPGKILPAYGTALDLFGKRDPRSANLVFHLASQAIGTASTALLYEIAGIMPPIELALPPRSSIGAASSRRCWKP